MEISATGTSVRILLSVRKTVVSMDAHCYRAYVTDWFDSMNDCYIGHAPDDGLMKQLAISKRRCEACEEVENRIIVAV